MRLKIANYKKKTKKLKNFRLQKSCRKVEKKIDIVLYYQRLFLIPKIL